MPNLTSPPSTSAAAAVADPSQPSLADAVAEALVLGGIDMAIGLDDPQPLFASLRASALRTVMVHDERSGAFMADGYARATRRPALCAAVAGPGATNLATGLLEALRTSSPMVAIVGEPRTARPGIRGFQGLEHEASLASVCKAVVRIEHADHGPAAVQHAVSLATTGRPGPVLLVVNNALWFEPAPEPVVGRNDC